MSEEFNLSEKRIDGIEFSYIPTEDVKEFLLRLKEEMSKVNIADGYGFTYLCEKIDKLAGEKLLK